MRLAIANKAILLTGDGPPILRVEGLETAAYGPTCAEIRLTRQRFKRLFGVAPVIRIQGRFHRDAMLQRDASDAAGPDVWPLMNNPEPVVFVGKEYITIRLTYPIAKRDTLRVFPEKGRNVQIRFTLPNT